MCGSVNSQYRNGVITTSVLEASHTTFGSKNDSFYTTRSFLQFDLSQIPVGSKINSARLNLFSGGVIADLGPNNFLLRRVTSIWSPSTITWNTQPSTALRGTVQLPATISFEQDYKNINVWTLVQAMVDSPSTSFGFALRLDTDLKGNTNRTLSFAPPGGSFPHRAPRLVIEYTPPGMQPAVTSMAVDLNGSSSTMSIFPNPCHGSFSCNIQSSATNNMSLRVIDMLGRTVYNHPISTSVSHTTVQLPSESRGIYFVIFQNKAGPIISQKLQVN